MERHCRKLGLPGTTTPIAWKTYSHAPKRPEPVCHDHARGQPSQKSRRLQTVVLAKLDLIDKLRVAYYRLFTVRAGVAALIASLSGWFRSRAALQLEVLALRHQIGVLQRSVKRPQLSTADRLLWVWITTVWQEWKSAAIIVTPSTVVGWHRKGFRLFGHGRFGMASRGGRRSPPTFAN